MSISITVLKTGPDRPVRPIQPGTGASPVRLKAPKPVNNRSTTGKPAKNQSKTGVEPKIKKKTVQYPVRFLKPCVKLLFGDLNPNPYPFTPYKYLYL